MKDKPEVHPTRPILFNCDTLRIRTMPVVADCKPGTPAEDRKVHCGGSSSLNPRSSLDLDPHCSECKSYYKNNPPYRDS